MKEIVGNIWDYHDQGYWVVITTNGFVKKNGEAVMGRGIALQAKNEFFSLPKVLGELIHKYGNHVFSLGIATRLFSFPVKHNWWEKANLDLIERSCKELLPYLDLSAIKRFVYMVRPGCGNGQLDWKDVKPILEKYFDDRFIVVEKKENGN